MAPRAGPGYNVPMRAVLLIAVFLAMTSAATAETLRLPPPDTSGKTLPFKGAAGTTKANSCASYGKGFYMVEATGSCVKLGGSVSVDTVTRR